MPIGMEAFPGTMSCFAWFQFVRDIESHLCNCTHEDEVQTTASIDVYSSEDRACHYWVQNEWKFSRLEEASPLIFPGEGYGYLTMP